MKAQTIAGASFWNDLNTEIRAGGGVGHFNDGDVQYAALNVTARMIVMQRTREELFETTIRQESRRLSLKAAINGNVYDVSRSGLIDAFAGHDPVQAHHTTPIGHVVIGNTVVGGRSEPGRFYVSHFIPGPVQSPADPYTFGFGNPPQLGTALGGLGPMIINKLKYGNGNRYRSGVPSGAPATGRPPAPHRPFLAQRNNNTYIAMASKGNQTGKVVMAICRSAQKILLLVQLDGASTGIGLDNLRDKLANVGVDDAVFFDGIDSAMLMINNTFHVSQGKDKDELTTIGLGFV